MYRIIGADGKEYGPVPADTLRLWMSQGRVTGQTSACLEGTAEWRPLYSFPEFAVAPGSTGSAAAGGGIRPAGASGFHGADVAEAMAADAIAHDYRFDISYCFSRAWELMLANFWLSVGAGAIVLVLTAAASAIPFGTWVLLYVLVGGLDWMFLKLLRGQRAEIADVFAGFSVAFIPLMLFSLVGQLLTSLGFLLCILPGIYLMVAWMTFTALIIIDKRIDFWPAMELSRKVVTHHWWHMFGLVLLCFLVNIAGTMALCVGIFFTFPLTTLVTVVAYEQVFSKVNPPAPPAA